MTVSNPQSPPNRQKIGTWLKAEWDHLSNMPFPTFCLLALPSLILFAIDPLLPILAWLIQRWAGSSWTWRDRWASVWVWARQGVWWVAVLAVLAWLVAVHFWFFPDLLITLQTAWRTAHLPGDVSLSPLDGHDLVARSLLLLPLAPLLARWNERIDPRTQKLQRILTPADLAAPVQKTVPPVAAQILGTNQATTPPSTQERTSTPPKTKRPRPAHKQEPPVEQMTIDSILSTDQAQTSAPPTKTQPGQKKNTQGKERQTSSTPKPEGPTKPDVINWDDVAE